MHNSKIPAKHLQPKLSLWTHRPFAPLTSHLFWGSHFSEASNPELRRSHLDVETVDVFVQVLQEWQSQCETLAVPSKDFLCDPPVHPRFLKR